MGGGFPLLRIIVPEHQPLSLAPRSGPGRLPRGRLPPCGRVRDNGGHEGREGHRQTADGDLHGRSLHGQQECRVSSGRREKMRGGDEIDQLTSLGR